MRSRKMNRLVGILPEQRGPAHHPAGCGAGDHPAVMESGAGAADHGALRGHAFFENAFFENFAIFWRARSRLYQNEILQENMRLTAFFKLYKICILLHRCNLKIFAKNRFEKSAIFVKIQQNFCKCRKICKILPNFKNFS